MNGFGYYDVNPYLMGTYSPYLGSVNPTYGLHGETVGASSAAPYISHPHSDAAGKILILGGMGAILGTIAGVILTKGRTKIAAKTVEKQSESLLGKFKKLFNKNNAVATEVQTGKKVQQSSAGDIVEINAPTTASPKTEINIPDDVSKLTPKQKKAIVERALAEEVENTKISAPSVQETFSKRGKIDEPQDFESFLDEMGRVDYRLEVVSKSLAKNKPISVPTIQVNAQNTKPGAVLLGGTGKIEAKATISPKKPVPKLLGGNGQ